MICQNCGKNEINFHYTSNINGCVTEMHLCSACAAKAGYNPERVFEADSFFDGFFPLNMRRAFLPLPILGFGLTSPFGIWPRMGLQPANCECGGTCEAPGQEKTETEVDGEMQKRREINAMREQMRLAAEKEDFEKATELRDQIRRMENSGD